MFTELQQMRQQLPDMEFGRRMAVERELEKVDGIRLTNIIFDETGHFVLYGTMLGIKVINVETNRYVKVCVLRGFYQIQDRYRVFGADADADIRG